MNKSHLKIFFQNFMGCLSGRNKNVMQVWLFILTFVLILITIGGIVSWKISAGIEDVDLFLLVKNNGEEEVVLNRGLLDQVLEFYNQKDVEFQIVKENLKKSIDPSQ